MKTVVNGYRVQWNHLRGWTEVQVFEGSRLKMTLSLRGNASKAEVESEVKSETKEY
jgi:hypothetical protein